VPDQRTVEGELEQVLKKCSASGVEIVVSTPFAAYGLIIASLRSIACVVLVPTFLQPPEHLDQCIEALRGLYDCKEYSDSDMAVCARTFLSGLLQPHYARWLGLRCTSRLTLVRPQVLRIHSAVLAGIPAGCDWCVAPPSCLRSDLFSAHCSTEALLTEALEAFKLCFGTALLLDFGSMWAPLLVHVEEILATLVREECVDVIFVRSAYSHSSALRNLFKMCFVDMLSWTRTNTNASVSIFQPRRDANTTSGQANATVRTIVIIGGDMSHSSLFELILLHSTGKKRLVCFHHGGVGTSTACAWYDPRGVASALALRARFMYDLRAGVPQIILPVLYDQPFWAVRMQQVGVGRSVRIGKLRHVVRAVCSR
jgi:hypothetical protein